MEHNLSVLNSRPIGIFDSGVGGLTVLKEIKKLLPDENIIYFGDTARVPYGTKSKSVISGFALQICRFLEKRGVKMIVAACNTVSSTSMDTLNENFNLPLVGVVIPGSREAAAKTKNNKIAVIGTTATITSGSYQRCITDASNASVKTYAKACPIFVPLAEEGWICNRPAYETAKLYLSGLKKTGADTIILGCTHYPLLKGIIRRVVGPKMRIVDSAASTAKAVKSELMSRNLLNSAGSSAIEYFVTDSPEKFGKLAKKFLGAPVEKIELVKIDE